jgi:hypothetical protein
MAYPNMEYCAARNTLAAVEQLIAIIEESGTENMEREEIRALGELSDAARYLGEIAATAIDDLYSTKIDD